MDFSEFVLKLLVKISVTFEKTCLKGTSVVITYASSIFEICISPSPPLSISLCQFGYMDHLVEKVQTLEYDSCNYNGAN